jgi:hypothetical protein
MQMQDLGTGVHGRATLAGELLRGPRYRRMLLRRATAVEAGLQERRHLGCLRQLVEQAVVSVAAEALGVAARALMLDQHAHILPRRAKLLLRAAGRQLLQAR